MTERIYNFSSGPATLPLEVLEKAAAEMTSFRGSGMSVMEISHRSKLFGEVLESAEAGIRRLLGLSDEYSVLFLQGGATLQFSMVPMNLLGEGETADYVVTGSWGQKAVSNARAFGSVNVIYSGEAAGFRTVPEKGSLRMSADAAYVHYTSNETIDGVEFAYDLDTESTPAVCDMSSDILSRPIDVGKYALIYAGAQKNIGPSGVTLVVIRRDLLDRKKRDMPAVLSYDALAKNSSMVNTPNTFGIYIVGLVCEWLEGRGGLAAIANLNAEKAAMLYDAIDSSDGFYQGHAAREARSLMNVTFRLSDAELEKKFVAEAEGAAMSGLAGHRSVGGIRASIYNAFPVAGIEALTGFMKDFADRNG